MLNEMWHLPSKKRLNRSSCVVWHGEWCVPKESCIPHWRHLTYTVERLCAAAMSGPCSQITLGSLVVFRPRRFVRYMAFRVRSVRGCILGKRQTRSK